MALAIFNRWVPLGESHWQVEGQVDFSTCFIDIPNTSFVLQSIVHADKSPV